MAIIATVGVFVTTPNQASAVPKGPGNFTAQGLSPASTISADKTASGRLARNDTALLKRSDSRPVHVMVKLDYDATASYRGGLTGLAATSPSVTGKRLTGKSAAEQAYGRYTARVDRGFRQALASRVPAARAGHSLRTVYGGIAVTLPANQAKTLLSIDGVAAVQADSLQHPDTVESPQFIGAPTVWAQEGGQALAGRGVIFADLDTGVWPEHPSFANNPALAAPPPTPGGTPRACDFGDNPLTPASDVFLCNHKLIGGQPFLATYNANNSGETYPDSARDSDGHGTHTTSTAAGDIVEHANPLGIDQGRISGVAPGAWIMEYKVCGSLGCYSSDSAAAVQQAILDGANVINFSISGGANPYSDPVELAFLDAYNAGVFVAASAGNSGPGAGTTDHRGPWVTTVAASTQSREFRSTLTVTASGGGASATFTGTTLTPGAGPAPIVLAQNVPGSDAGCSTPLAPGVAAGKIVACQRGGVGRVQKGFNAKSGGAVGMILYNPTLADTESDNHWLPAIHLADGTAFLAFLNDHPDSVGSWPAGSKSNGQGDVMAAFSSRGPGGQFLKPDITAPGVQILAGNTPTPDDVALGPPGNFYQAIAGTSMSAPHIAGSAILMKALHPNWTPGTIKSALMTTATTKVVKQDLTTPADPFDDGAGRVDLTKSGSAPIVFDETAARMVSVGSNPLTAPNLNLPSVNVPSMPGTVVVSRTARNVTSSAYKFTVATKAPTGSSITVFPRSGTIAAGKSRTFLVRITSKAPTGQYFGQIAFNSNRVQVHLPVAFFNKQGDATLTQTCAASSLTVNGPTACTVTAQNNSARPAKVAVASTVTNGLRIDSATGATVNAQHNAAGAGPVTLAAPKDAVPAIAAGSSPAGYLPLAEFGISATPIGDEQILNFNVPEYAFGGKTYSRVGVDANGYLLVGGSDNAADNSPVPQTLPDAAPPNGVLAPYWSDLDGTGAPGVYVATLTDGVDSWVVVQWSVNVFGTSSARNMEVWIGVNGVEDISYSYDPGTLNADAPAGYGLTIGAENLTGTSGAQISGVPTSDYVVTTTPGQPGETLRYTLNLRATRAGPQILTSSMLTDVVNGVTTVRTPIAVTKN